MNRKWIKGWENLEIKKRGVQLAEEARFEVQRLADYYEMSAKTLNRRFKQQLKEPPWQWLQRMRFEIAREMIAAGKMTKEVSATLGYANEANFIRAFKKVHGCTPLDYYKKKLLSNSGLNCRYSPERFNIPGKSILLSPRKPEQ